MRTPFALALAALLAVPALAGAESLAVADAAAVTGGIEQAEVVRVRNLFQEALRDTGIQVTPVGHRGPKAEYVASLTLARDGSDVLVTAQVSRLKLDLWATRAQVRVRGLAPESLTAGVQDLASQIALAVRTAPARNETQPAARPAARKLSQGHPVLVPAAGDAPAAAAQE